MIRTLESMLKKLKEYESLEEQGRLVRLPCKVEDTVYVRGDTLYSLYCYRNYNYEPCEVIGIKTTRKQKLLNIAPHKAQAMNNRYHQFYPFSCIGKTVFLTKSEAEKALEMEVPK